MPLVDDFDRLRTQYDILANHWRHFNTIIWGVPTIAITIMSGILIGAYSSHLNGWPLVITLGIGSLMLFSLTIELVKKRYHMNVISFTVAVNCYQESDETLSMSELI
jgi:hypothetical protein